MKQVIDLSFERRAICENVIIVYSLEKTAFQEYLSSYYE